MHISNSQGMGTSSMNNETELIIHDLINKSFDGSITSSEFEELNRLIKSDPECAAYYVSSIKIHLAFSKAGRLFREHTGETLSDSRLFLQEFAEYEKTAPVVQIAKAKAQVQSKLEQETVQTVPVQKISRLPILTLITSCVALLMVFIYVYLNPQMSEVATLADSINPEWVNPESSAPVGSRLMTTTKPVALKQGIIKIRYDNDIEVLIEAPAEYQILSSKEMVLRSGRLFAKVAPAGRGFAVQTNHTRIVDLGTEFGVYSDSQNKTELHVFKGKTTLTSTAVKSAKNLGVIGGQAREVDVAGGVKEIQLNNDGFIRAINSKTNVVWRGQKLDLADIVGGGNGLGTGRSNVFIHPVEGLTDKLDSHFSTSKEYHRLLDNSFVDGVFVPGGSAKQIVTSRGDVFAECPKTSGIFDYHIMVNPKAEVLKTDLRAGTIIFNQQVYGQNGRPCIVMHSNLGITLNLDAIRQFYQGSITRFVSRVGIADLQEPHPCNADFWVLVDGKVRYSLQRYKQKGVLNDVSVEIKDTDRFLTLMTTDGGDADDPASCYTRAISCDWCVFTEPALTSE
jgi:hypothetical protein